MAQTTLENIALPADLYWSDEFAWTPVEQQTTYALDGAFVVEQAGRQAGRPITLQGAEDQAWITRETLLELYELAATPGAELSLTLADDREFTVLFRHRDGAIEARPVMKAFPPAAGDFYEITLRFMEV